MRAELLAVAVQLAVEAHTAVEAHIAVEERIAVEEHIAVGARVVVEAHTEGRSFVVAIEVRGQGLLGCQSNCQYLVARLVEVEGRQEGSMGMEVGKSSPIGTRGEPQQETSTGRLDKAGEEMGSDTPQD